MITSTLAPLQAAEKLAEGVGPASQRDVPQVGPGFSPDTNRPSSMAFRPRGTGFHKFPQMNGGKNVPQGLKANGFCAWMSGLKPGPTQQVAFSATCEAVPSVQGVLVQSWLSLCCRGGAYCV